MVVSLIGGATTGGKKTKRGGADVSDDVGAGRPKRGKCRRCTGGAELEGGMVSTTGAGRPKKRKGGASTGGKKPESAWIKFAKAFAKANKMIYKDALKPASDAYRQLKNK
jgi:hypothetical protein